MLYVCNRKTFGIEGSCNEDHNLSSSLVIILYNRVVFLLPCDHVLIALIIFSRARNNQETIGREFVVRFLPKSPPISNKKNC